MGDIYNKIILNSKIILGFNKVNSDLYNTLQYKIQEDIEGRCIIEGFVKRNSTKILSYSSGELVASNILFEVAYETMVANPVEGNIIECKVHSITKAGIKATIEDDNKTSPYLIFIARDHHYSNEDFAVLKENDLINIKVLGKRYEIHDKYISIIAELITQQNKDSKEQSKKGKKQ